MLSVAIFVSIGWIISVCLHEFGHAIIAYWGGDTSVKEKGYLTLNPLKYTDINLSLTLPLIFVLMGGIPLPGAAVYINHNRLRNRWWQSAVSAAGPVTSAIVALLLALPFKLGLALPNSESLWIWSALAFLIYLQIYVTIINSLPIPSLDGYGVIEPWLPQQVQAQLGKFSKFGILFLFGMLWFVQPISRFLGNLSASIASFFGVPVEMIGEGSSLFHRAAGILLLAAIGIIFIIRRLTRKTHEVRFEQGQTFSKSGQYEKAIAAYDQAIKHKPDYYEAWINRGIALDKLQRYTEALESYDRAIKIQPDHIDYWFYRGYTLCKMQDYEEAIACFDKAIQFNPKNTFAWYNKACCYAEQNKVDLANESLQQAINLEPHTVKNLAKTDPSFDSIRDNPLFKQLIDE